MATSLLALLDDVAMLTKIAATKTAPVLTDDLAVNADQLSGGIKPERELAVVWQVFVGSLKNKALIVPIALALSYYLPMLIPILLVIGGMYLVYEGAEKVIHWWMHRGKEDESLSEFERAMHDESIDLVEFEKEKIKGAIVTDAVLSAEIVIIALGAIADQTFQMKAIVLTFIAIALTIGVYGLVAGIVKLDDGGLALIKDKSATLIGRLKRIIGNSMLWFAEKLMSFLAIAGTIAMFTVGGSIIAHEIDLLGQIVHFFEHLVEGIPDIGSALKSIVSITTEIVIGLFLGCMLVGLQGALSKSKKQTMVVPKD